MLYNYRSTDLMMDMMGEDNPRRQLEDATPSLMESNEINYLID